MLILTLFQGFWSRHFPAFKQLCEEIDKKSIGEVKMITVYHGQDIIDRGDRIKYR